jgi:hypothetical protein
MILIDNKNARTFPCEHFLRSNLEVGLTNTRSNIFTVWALQYIVLWLTIWTHDYSCKRMDVTFAVTDK